MLTLSLLPDNPTYSPTTKPSSPSFKILAPSLVFPHRTSTLLHIPNPYLIPKIHKPNNLGRKMASSDHSIIECVSAFVNYHLKHNVKSLTSYIKDNDFLTIPCFSSKIPCLQPLMSPPYTPSSHILMVSPSLRNNHFLCSFSLPLPPKYPACHH